jgi:hypothetical protein
MEPEGSLPCSQKSATGPFPEPTESISPHGTKSHVLFPLLRSCQRISSGPRHFETFRNNTNFLRWGGLLAPRPTPKVEDHPLSAVRNCLFIISAATLHIWRTSLHPQRDDAPCCGDKDPHNNTKNKKLWSSSLCNFLQPPVTSSLSCPRHHNQCCIPYQV